MIRKKKTGTKNKVEPANRIPQIPGLPEKILEAIGSPVFIKDRQHRWIYLNDAFCIFIGRKHSELIGRLDGEFFPPEQAEIFREKDELVFRTGKENVNEERFTDAAGAEHTIVTRKQVLKEKDGREILVGVINDITELHQAHNRLSIFRHLLESANDAIFILDQETGAFLDVNDTACRRLGYPRKTLLRMGVSDIEVTAAGPAGWEAIKQKVLDSGALLAKGSHKRADGTSFPVEVSISRAEMDGKKYILANARDITERQKMEEAMKEVDTLRGLIPICAKCKKIRDDKGFWEKVEIYLEKHSSARFTHGLCKDCMKDLYGKEAWFRDSEHED